MYQNRFRHFSSVASKGATPKEGFKALEKYGIGEVINLRNRYSDDDEAKGISIKLLGKTKAFDLVKMRIRYRTLHY